MVYYSVLHFLTCSMRMMFQCSVMFLWSMM
jgi:hypothetical protein